MPPVVAWRVGDGESGLKEEMSLHKCFVGNKSQYEVNKSGAKDEAKNTRDKPCGVRRGVGDPAWSPDPVKQTCMESEWGPRGLNG